MITTLNICGHTAVKSLITIIFAYYVSGSDSRIRLWDIESGRNTLVNFETGRIQTNKGIQLDTSDDPALVFVPCMKTVKVVTNLLLYQHIFSFHYLDYLMNCAATVYKAFGMWSGRTTLMLRGHYESVNTCCFNSNDQV
jgi:DNA excision repair protein ERCC-8